MIDSGREARLVLQASTGDREALEILLSGMQPYLFRYILRLVGRTAAHDVLQETFLQICRNLKWLREADLIRRWAYRIASRASFACLKRERRYSHFETEGASPDEVVSPSEPAAQLFRDVLDLLEEVSPASRAVLTLHYVEDLPIEEAAAILDISVGTAKSRLAYGLSQLRKILERK